MSWYALQIRTNQSELVREGLRFHGITEYEPRYKEKSLRRYRWRIEKPLFPGYVFACFDLEDLAQRHRVISVPGILRIVGYGDQPLPIPDSEIESIRNLIRSGLPLTPMAVDLKKDDQVLVTGGPLAGTYGVVVLIKGKQRIIVSIGLLNRGVCCEVDADCLEPVKAA